MGSLESSLGLLGRSSLNAYKLQLLDKPGSPKGAGHVREFISYLPRSFFQPSNVRRESSTTFFGALVVCVNMFKKERNHEPEAFTTKHPPYRLQSTG